MSGKAVKSDVLLLLHLLLSGVWLMMMLLLVVVEHKKGCELNEFGLVHRRRRVESTTLDIIYGEISLLSIRIRYHF